VDSFRVRFGLASKDARWFGGFMLARISFSYSLVTPLPCSMESAPALIAI